MFFDLSTLAAGYTIYILSVWIVGFKKSELSLYTAIWLTFYLGYTFFIVGNVGSYINFYILAAIAGSISFLYANHGKSLNKRDRAACLIMYLPFIYNLGVSNEWLIAEYGAFDQYYTPFMQTTYICLLALSFLNMLFEKIKLNIEIEEVKKNDALGGLAVDSSGDTKLGDLDRLFCYPFKIKSVA